MKKNELTLIAFGTILTFALLLGIGIAVDTQDSVDYTNSDIRNLRSEIAELRGNVWSLESDIGDLDDRIYDIERRRR